jgi:hypothetical protein
MPATSKKQRTLMCIALAIKEGKTPKSYSKEAARLAGSMSVEQLRDYCKSPVKGA